MYPIKSLDKRNVLKLIAISLLGALFTTGLIYMADWKLESEMPFYYYIGSVFLMFFMFALMGISAYKYKKKKKKSDESED